MTITNKQGVLRTTQRKGYGNDQHLPAGHIKRPRGVFKEFIGGNGCKRHSDCLTCPFPIEECR
jgi:hypothetical protein